MADSGSWPRASKRPLAGERIVDLRRAGDRARIRYIAKQSEFRGGVSGATWSARVINAHPKPVGISAHAMVLEPPRPDGPLPAAKSDEQTRV